MVVWECLIEYTLIYTVKTEMFRRVLIVFWMRSLAMNTYREFACHLVNDQLDFSSEQDSTMHCAFFGDREKPRCRSSFYVTGIKHVRVTISELLINEGIERSHSIPRPVVAVYRNRGLRSEHHSLADQSERV